MELDELAARVDSLQRQIVELRLRLDQSTEANAALMDHAAQKAVDAKIGGRSLTETERDWVRISSKSEDERRRMRTDIATHVIKWGVGGTLGFIAYSAWESIKAKVRM